MSELAKMLREAASKPPPSKEFVIASSLEDIFEFEPIPLRPFIEESKYLDGVHLSNTQFEVLQYLERIYFDGWDIDDDGNRFYDPSNDLYSLMAKGGMDSYWSQKVRMINFVTLQWGKGSGKDLISQYGMLRVAYLLLALKSPQRYFGKPPSDSIHMLNVASSATQANRVFFKPLKRMVRRGWFEDNASVSMNSIEFAKGIEAISGHSDADTQEGLNLIFGVADEIDAFDSKEAVKKGGAPTQRSVEDILDLLHTSGSTRFPQTYKNVRMSYPRYKGSHIQTLTEKAKKDIKKYGEESNHFVSGPLATWEVNPSKRKVEYAKEYEDNPALAASKYECKPTLAINAYFPNEIAVKAAFIDKEQPIRIVEYRLINDKYWMPIYEFASDFHAIRGANYAMHGDLAVTSDRAGIAMSHVVKKAEVETEVLGEHGEVNTFWESRSVINVDFVISFTSDKSTKPPREIQIRWARQLAVELLKRGFSIQLFTFDKFESKDSMQILEDIHGVESKRVSADISLLPYKTLKDVINEARIKIPVSGLALKEILSLNLLPNGRVDHPPGGSKDLSDAIACSVMGALELGGQENEDQEQSYYGDASFEIGTTEAPIDMPFGFASDMLGWGSDVGKW